MKNEQTWVSGIFKLGIAGKSETDNVISASQISKYNTCPKQWELRYIKKERLDGPSIHLVFGNAMHEVLQEWLKIMYTKTVKASMALPIEDMLKARIRELYLDDFKKYKKHFSTPEQLAEFYTDGVEILKFIKSNRGKYFTTKKVQLIGIELPIMWSPSEEFENLKFMGFLDLVFYDENADEYHIIDIKTSTRGWSEKDKKNKDKSDQILLYKRYMSAQYGVPEAKIKVSFFIVRRKINPDSMWPIKRVQEFKPSSGKPSVNKSEKKLLKFINKAFNPDGSYNKDIEYPAIKGVNSYNCTFCAYKDREDLCPKNKRVTACFT